MTSAAKTMAECFKFRNKIGLDVALEALRECPGQRRRLDDLAASPAFAASSGLEFFCVEVLALLAGFEEHESAEARSSTDLQLQLEMPPGLTPWGYPLRLGALH